MLFRNTPAGSAAVHPCEQARPALYVCALITTVVSKVPPLLTYKIVVAKACDPDD